MPLPTQRPAPGTLTWTVSTRLRQPDGSWGSWQPLQPVPFGTGSFVVRGLQPGGVYEFRVNDNTNTYNRVFLLYGGVLRLGDCLFEVHFVCAFRIGVITNSVSLFLREKKQNKENATEAEVKGEADSTWPRVFLTSLVSQLRRTGI